MGDCSFESRRLERAWRVRLRARAKVDDALLIEIEDCLFSLERLDRGAFNVYPAHYDPSPPQPAMDAIARLRILGATSGVSNESRSGWFRLHIEPGPVLV